MSYKSGRNLDGYTLNASQNAFVTPWLDVHSSPFLNMKLIFAGAVPDGYATLEESNDREATWTNGQTYPASAQYYGSYGFGPQGDPVDLATTINSSQFINTEFVQGNPATTFTWNLTNTASARWYRIKYLPVADVAGVVTTTFCWKSSS